MKLKGAVIRSVVQQNAALVIAFGTGIIIARLITPAEFGAYSVAIAVLYIAMALKDFGIGAYVISDACRDEALLRSGHGLSLALTAALTALLVALSWPLASLYGDDMLGHVLRIAACGPLVLALVFPATVRLTQAMRFDALLIIGTSGALAQALVSILLALGGLGPAALGWGTLAGSGTTALATLAYGAGHLRSRPSAANWRQFLGFSGWMSATLLVGSTATSTPQLMIGRTLGLGEAALFARANTIVSLVLNMFFYAVTRPMLPGLTAAEHRDGNIAPLYLRIVESITGFAWPAYAALCIWAVPLVSTLYGPNWSGAGAMMLPIALGHALALAVAPHHDVLIVKRRPGLLFASELAVFLFTLAALAVGLTLGLGQAIWALTLSGGFFAVWYFFVLRQAARFRVRDLFAVWGRSLVLVAAVLPALLAFSAVHAAGLLPFPVAFVLSGIVSGILWVMAIRLSEHELSRHITPMLDGMIGLTLRSGTVKEGPR